MPFYKLILAFILFYSPLTLLYSQNKDVNNKIDAFIESKVKEYDIPGLSIGVIQANQIIINKGYGYADIASKKKVTQHSIFHVASVSKLFTAMAIMQLIEKGNFQLENKIIDILPEFKMKDERYKEITIQQLLNHTSGIGDVTNYHWATQSKDPKALEKYAKSLSSKSLIFSPGTDFRYSNSAFELLGYIVEVISKKPFEEYVKKYIQYDAGMTQSDFRYYKIRDEFRTKPYTKSISGKVKERKHYPYNRMHSPSSTLNASTYELMLWMKELGLIYTGFKKHSFLKPETLKLMFEPTFEAYNKICLTWFTQVIEGKKCFYHFGGDTGFQSYLIFIPEEKTGLVVLANCDFKEDFRQEILHEIVRLLFKK